jgi:hypothetical protein
MENQTFKFISQESLTSGNDPMLLAITASFLEGIVCNVAEYDYQFSDVELNRIAYALQYGEFEDVRWQLDGALIDAMRHALDPSENWSELDKDFLQTEHQQN